VFDFEKFPVYIRAEQAYDLVINSVLNRKDIRPKLKDQLERASMSVVLNIAEGAGKYSKNDKKNYYLTSRASAQECVSALRLLRIEKKVSDELFAKTYALFEEICKMLSGLINKMLE
jgi:four helix bundle protein